MKLILAALLLGLGASPAAGETLEYDIVSTGIVNGGSTVTITAGGNVEIVNWYQSQDKNRELKVSVSTDTRGLPTRMTRKGEAFAFAAIDEVMTLADGIATWRNRIESGSALMDDRYYVPLGISQAGDSAAFELGMLAHALANDPDRSIDLLPVGTARAAVVRQITVSDHGESADLRLVAVTGLSLEPAYVWLDARGRLFAGRETIRKGWRAVQAGLDRELAAADEEALHAAVRATSFASAPRHTVIRNVAVFDPRRQRILPDRTVILDEGRVQRVLRKGGARPSPRTGALIIDGRGMTLVPGLWDMHVHLRPREALRHLASGVTTVRDMGNNNERLRSLEARIVDGALPGPNIIKAGFIEGLSPITTYNGTLVRDEAEAVVAVNSYADAGYAQIKLYNAVRPEWVPAIARATHARGMRLSGHVPMGSTLARALTDGYDEVQHLIYPLLELGDKPAEAPLTFNAARAIRAVPVSSPKVATLAAKMRRQGIAMDMTLAVYEPLFLAEPGVPSPVFRAHASRLPPAMLREVALGALPTPADMTRAQFRDGYAKALGVARAFHDHGVQLIAGTDFAPLSGLALPRELELMVQSGISPAAALSVATFEAAKLMKLDREVGTIEPGKRADAILVRGDPSADILAIRNVVTVFKAGISYDPDSLLAVGIPQ